MTEPKNLTCDTARNEGQESSPHGASGNRDGGRERSKPARLYHPLAPRLKGDEEKAVLKSTNG